MRAAILALAALALTCESLPGVGSAALAQGQRSGRKFGPGVCGPIDPAYIRTAEETGGQVLILSPDELSNPGVITSPARGGAILIARGEGARTYSVPVESSVTHVVFSAWFDGQGGVLSVLSPEGLPVHGGQGVQDTALNCGRIVRVDAPAAGRWQLQLAPTNGFWLRADATGGVSLGRVEFLQKTEEDGVAKPAGRLLAGRQARLRVRLSPGHAAPELALVSRDAERIQDLELEPARNPDSIDAEDEGHLTGTFDIPGGAFRVLVYGADSQGAEYQRVSDVPFRAEGIEVVGPTGDTISPGVHSVTFTIRNFGPAVRLKLVATGGGKVLPVTPPVLDLEHGAEGLATVRLAVPADAGRVDVLLAAESEGDSPTMNYATKEFIVQRVMNP